MSAWKNLILLVPVFLCGCATGFDRHGRDDAADVAGHYQANCFKAQTELFAAVRADDAVRIRELLRTFPELANEYERGTKRPLTPLQVATERNQPAAMLALIECGADLQAGADSSEGTPLQMAARNGHKEATDMLLNSGATLDLYSAVALNKIVSVERFFRVATALGVSPWFANSRWTEPGGRETPLLLVAITNGHLEMVRLLLEHGASPFAQTIINPCFISDNNFKGTTIGLTPVGPPTGDLDVPIRKP
ncbi:MAG: ankyrin repeat domain-containing protein [Planctomycetes bacterium]|nr:ankyrin repeat domain-containing protein [Planctomycetota bacterium]